MDDTLRARLCRLDSCAVADALDSLGLEGVVAGLAQWSTSRRIAGRVVTVRIGVGPPGASPVRHLGTAAIEAAEPGDVIVVEHRSGVEAGGWGGLLSLGAALRGVAGVIVDGYARDIDESRSLDFAVFARAVTARTARGRVVELGTNEPIRVGDVLVRPGDAVVADTSAVVFVPADRVAEVVELAERVAAREAGMAAALRQGGRIVDVMGGGYERLLTRLAHGDGGEEP